MNRRKLLKGILGVGAALFGGRALADKVEGQAFYELGEGDFTIEGAARIATAKDVGYWTEFGPGVPNRDDFEMKYWESQHHISELYEELKK